MHKKSHTAHGKSSGADREKSIKSIISKVTLLINMGKSTKIIIWSFLILMCIMMEVKCKKYGEHKFSIEKTWNDKETGHDPIVINLYSEDEYIVMKIDAPFFNDPLAPNGEKGQPFPNLWDYEVVEAFFLGKDDKYLEVEFSPHGQHLLLLLSGRKNAIKMCLPVEYTASINGNTWHGLAKIPKSYFPPHVDKFNAYAIHGSGQNRTYEALYPVPDKTVYDYPDFHRLEFFKHVNFSDMLPDYRPLSEVWKDALKNSSEGEKLEC